MTVTYELGGPRAHINGLRVWPYSYPTQAPGEFTWQGAMSSSGTYSTVVSATHVTYETSTFNTFYGYFFAKPYQSYRLTLNSAVSGSMIYATEVQPQLPDDHLQQQSSRVGLLRCRVSVLHAEHAAAS